MKREYPKYIEYVALFIIAAFLVVFFSRCTVSKPVPQQQKQARLLTYKVTGFNRFECDFIKMKGDTLKKLPWYVPGAKKYTPEPGKWHTVYFYEGNKVSIYLNR